MSPKQLHTSRLLDATKCLVQLGKEEGGREEKRGKGWKKRQGGDRGEERRGEEQVGYVTPLSVLCLSQCSDVSFLTALVSNLAFLLFLEPGRQPERDYKTVNVDFSSIFMRHLSFLITAKCMHS